MLEHSAVVRAAAGASFTGMYAGMDSQPVAVDLLHQSFELFDFLGCGKLHVPRRLHLDHDGRRTVSDGSWVYFVTEFH